MGDQVIQHLVAVGGTTLHEMGLPLLHGEPLK